MNKKIRIEISYLISYFIWNNSSNGRIYAYWCKWYLKFEWFLSSLFRFVKIWKCVLLKCPCPCSFVATANCFHLTLWWNTFFPKGNFDSLYIFLCGIRNGESQFSFYISHFPNWTELNFNGSLVLRK